MNTEQNNETDKPLIVKSVDWAEIRLNTYRAVKAIAIVLVFLTTYNWIINNTELGKKFRFSSEFLISVGSGVLIALFQYANEKQKQRLEASKSVQEENRTLIVANHEKVNSLITVNHEKVTTAVATLERRIDSALLQINQHQTDFGEVLITLNQVQAEIENHEDRIADNRHEALKQDFEVYKELTNVKTELTYIKGLLGLPAMDTKNPLVLPGGK